MSFIYLFALATFSHAPTATDGPEDAAVVTAATAEAAAAVATAPEPAAPAAAVTATAAASGVRTASSVAETPTAAGLAAGASTEAALPLALTPLVCRFPTAAAAGAVARDPCCTGARKAFTRRGSLLAPALNSSKSIVPLPSTSSRLNNSVSSAVLNRTGMAGGVGKRGVSTRRRP